MQIAQTIQQVRVLVRNARKNGLSIGFVPTMGALHSGHISLIERAKKESDFVAVSIFVNPAQFGPNEDFEKYPRPIEQDLQICRNCGVDLVFCPSSDEIYSGEQLTWVYVDKLTETLCGRFRPGHFRGVTTVCTKLFNIITPDFAFFGQKDAQQAIVIKRMAADLNMPLEIIICPTVREEDGLAMSSRNKYLSPQERKDAPLIYKSLQKVSELVKTGVYDSSVISAEIKKILAESQKIAVEYVEIANFENLEPQESVKGKTLIAVAAKIGLTRLIDNIILDAP
ncbi:MAG: pantoate--beta-alanine ligase [Phycisphaerae bacterium]